VQKNTVWDEASRQFMKFLVEIIIHVDGRCKLHVNSKDLM